MADQEGINQNQMVDAGIDLRGATTNICDTLARDPKLTGILELFRKVNMDAMLDGPDLVTLFAPQSTDTLAGQDGDELMSALRGHMLGRAVTLDELRTTSGVITLARSTLKIERDGTGARVNGVRIVRPDVPCTNGVLHVIERALV
jgi:uncharacterized surface protein with fasciclin (FAS1) repeats